MRIEIKHKTTNEIMVSGEGDTESEAILNAIKNSFKPDENFANLESANLESANLYRANLKSANLYRANLKSANLESANLESANLENANLVHVDSRNLQLDEDKEILFRMDCCVWPITIWHNKVHIGCKEFEFSEILEMTEEKAESINDGAGKRWKRFGNTLKTAILDIQSSGI